MLQTDTKRIQEYVCEGVKDDLLKTVQEINDICTKPVSLHKMRPMKFSRILRYHRSSKSDQKTRPS